MRRLSTFFVLLMLNYAHVSLAGETPVFALDRYPSGWTTWASKGDSIKPELSFPNEGLTGETCAQAIFPQTGRQVFLAKFWWSPTPTGVNAISFWARSLNIDSVSCDIWLSEREDNLKDNAESFSIRKTFTPNWIEYTIPFSELKKRPPHTKGDNVLSVKDLGALRFNFFQIAGKFGIQVSRLKLVKIDEKPEQSRTGNLFRFDTDFETYGTAFSYYSTPNADLPSRDSSKAYHGKHSLKIPGTRDGWVRCLDWIKITHDKKYTLSFYAKAESDNVDFRIACFSNRWKNCGQKHLQLSSQWKRYEMEVSSQENTDAFFALGLNDPDGKTVWIDCIQFQEGKITPHSDSQVHAGITTGATGEVLIKSSSPTSLKLEVWKGNTSTLKNDDAVMYIECKDHDGGNVFSETLSISFSNSEPTTRTISSGKSLPIGHYTIDMLMRDKAGTILRRWQRAFAVVNPKNKAEEVRLLFGLNTGGACLPWDAMQKIGVQSLRTMPNLSGLRWPGEMPEAGELEKNKFIWPESLSGINKASVFTPISVLKIPEWAKSNETQIVKPELYADLFKAVVDSKKPVEITFEIENEPHLTIWKHSNRSLEEAATAYAEVVNATAKKLGSIKNISACGSNLEFTSAVMKKAGKSFSILPWHPYSGSRYIGPYSLNTVGPEQNQILEKLIQYDNLIKKYGAGQEIWLGEFGYAYDVNSGYDSLYPRETAILMARTFILAAAAGNVKRMYWFIAANAGGSGENGYFYGMWNHNAPMPAVPVYAFMAEQLKNAIPKGILSRSYGAYACAFEQADGSASLFVWDWRENGLSITLESGELELRDIFGRTIEVPNENFEIALNKSPLLLSSKSIPAEVLLKRFEEVLDNNVPLAFQIRTPDADTILIHIINNHDKTLAGTLYSKVGKKEFSNKLELLPRGSKDITLKLENGIPLKGGVLEFYLSRNPHEKLHLKTELLPDYAVSVPAGTDPSLFKIELGAPHVTPPDPIVGWTGLDDCSATAWLEWDNATLTLHVQVKDDKHHNDKQAQDIWRGDSIQFAFDTMNDASLKSVGYDANDYEYGVALNSDGKVMKHCWHAPPDEDKTALAKELQADVRREDNLTIYKVRIPWNCLRPFTPKAGNIMGFSFIVNDNDGENTRNYYLAFTPGLSEKIPGHFKKLVLMGNK